MAVELGILALLEAEAPELAVDWVQVRAVLPAQPAS
jgi:hypothetical protein